MLCLLVISLACSDGSRLVQIGHEPLGGVPTYNLVIFAKSYMKMKEIGVNRGRIHGAPFLIKYWFPQPKSRIRNQESVLRTHACLSLIIREL